MGKKIKEFTINLSKGGFSFKKHGIKKEDYDFSGVATLRRILSNEKARILDVIKNEMPRSIYGLAKRLGRNFKSVNEDIKLLERFGFVERVAEKTGKREHHRLMLNADTIIIKLEI